MPLYEYQCTSCGQRFEVLQRMGASATGLACPECGRPEVEREFSTFASASAGGGPGASAAACGPSSRFT